jgi:hypothetical protein
VPPGSWLVSSWSTLSGGTPPGPLAGSVQLEVWRPTVTTSEFSLVGISPAVTTAASGLNTFTLTPPINAQGGDILGLRTMTLGYGCARLAGAFVFGVSPSPVAPAVGEQRSIAFIAGALNVSATLEAVGPARTAPVPTTIAPLPARPRLTG